MYFLSIFKYYGHLNISDTILILLSNIYFLFKFFTIKNIINLDNLQIMKC
jgi:hypothetical protein